MDTSTSNDHRWPSFSGMCVATGSLAVRLGGDLHPVLGVTAQSVQRQWYWYFRDSIPSTTSLLLILAPALTQSLMRPIIVVALLAASVVQAQQPVSVPTAAEQVAAAVTPLPEELKSGAAVLGYKWRVRS